jgi:branched-chain amino acid transport system permease protein
MSVAIQNRNTAAAAAFAICMLFVVASNPVWTDTWTVLGVYSLLAVSAGVGYGQAGILSMSQGAFAAIGGYVAAFSGQHAGFPPYCDLVLALLLPGLLAYALARFVTRLTPLATALATLALGAIVEIAARNWDAVTGGYIGIAGIPGLPAADRPIVYCILVWSMVCIWIFFYENLMNSAFGRALNVIRSDRLRAEADGVDVTRLLSATFAFSAAIAGSAGWLYAHYISFMSPQSLDGQMSISALLMAVIGGARFVLGPIVGAVVFDSAVRFLPAQELSGLFYGLILVVVLLLARDGLMGAIAYFRTSVRARVAELREDEVIASGPFV